MIFVMRGRVFTLQAGTPLFALQEMAGWETEKMVRRYAHLAADHLAPHAQRMADYQGTFLAQPEKGGVSADE